LEDVPPEAMCMILPFWPFRAEAPAMEGFTYSVASMGPALADRRYLLVYYVPLEHSRFTTGGEQTLRASKKRSRGNVNLERHGASTPVSGRLLPSRRSPLIKGRMTSFHVVARILSAAEFRDSGIRQPSAYEPEMSEAKSAPSCISAVIAVCQNSHSGVELVPEGLEKLGLCAPVYDWQSEADQYRSLTPTGVEVVELVWAGCVALLGIGR